MTLYNINIKVIGDIWDYQDYHDKIIDSFKFSLERLLDTPHYYGLRGDLNFKYHSEERKFEIVSLPQKYDGRIRYLFEISSDFRKKYIIYNT